VKGLDRKAGPYPYYGASGIIGHIDDFIFDGEYLLVAEDGENLRTRKTPIAFLADGKFWVNNHAHIIRGNHLAETRYLCYLLSVTDISGYLTGSTQPKLTQGNLNRIPLRLPSVATQRWVVSVLDSLTDKIQLNRRMNRTLEAIAQAIFKSWFIDFDPVIDNAILNGKPIPDEFAMRAEICRAELGYEQVNTLIGVTGRSPLPENIRCLFPGEFQDSELGPIPNGWEVRPFSEMAENVKQKVAATPGKDCEKYMALDDMPSGSVCLDTWRPGSEVNSSIIRFHKHDLLFGSMRPYFHKVGLAPFDGITRTTTFVLRPAVLELRLFTLFHLASQPVIEFSTNTSVGTTIPYVKWESLGSYRVPVPPTDLLLEFHRFVNPILLKTIAAAEQTQIVAVARDAILPRLMSGAFDVGFVGLDTGASR
jgi:type I restriction enzyme S subunit